jgi:hypothetical protein
MVLAGYGIRSYQGGAPAQLVLGPEVVSPDPAARAGAVRNLAGEPNRNDLAVLVKVLGNDPAVSDLAALALIQQGRAERSRPRENPVVLAVSEAVGAAYLLPERRAKAAWVLGEIGDRRALGVLRGAGPGADEVGLQVARALDKLGYTGTARALELTDAQVAERLRGPARLTDAQVDDILAGRTAPPTLAGAAN